MKMKMLLTTLTPAETLLIRMGEEASRKDLLKYTFMDLLLKQVLTIQDVERQPSSRDPVKTYKYVYAGKNFSKYSILPHEMIYLSVFRKSAGGILFRNFVKMGYENARPGNALHRKVISSPTLQDLFTSSFLQKVFGGFSYTDKGLQVKELIRKEIEELERDIPSLMLHDRAKALEKLKLIGGNIFLVLGLEFSLLKEIEEELTKEMRKQESTSGCSSSCGTFTGYGNDFDSSCSSDSGSDGSGCSSGDSGCGGGCGGCGGGGD